MQLVMMPFHTKIVLDPADFTGSYRIDKNMFAGKNAEWQYEHFSFIIDHNDIVFSSIDGDGTVTRHHGEVRYSEAYSSTRIEFKYSPHAHHIVHDQPAIYRNIWDFTIVLNSHRYGNMYFKKVD